MTLRDVIDSNDVNDVNKVTPVTQSTPLDLRENHPQAALEPAMTGGV
jgi:hypothetical protein